MASLSMGHVSIVVLTVQIVPLGIPVARFVWRYVSMAGDGTIFKLNYYFHLFVTSLVQCWDPKHYALAGNGSCVDCGHLCTNCTSGSSGLPTCLEVSFYVMSMLKNFNRSIKFLLPLIPQCLPGYVAVNGSCVPCRECDTCTLGDSGNIVCTSEVRYGRICR